MESKEKDARTKNKKKDQLINVESKQEAPTKKRSRVDSTRTNSKTKKSKHEGKRNSSQANRNSKMPTSAEDGEERKGVDESVPEPEKFYIMPDDKVGPHYEGFPGQIAEIPEDEFGRLPLILRPEGSFLKTKIDTIHQSRIVRFDKEILSGVGGGGKSTAMLQAVTHARRKGWLVFYIIEGKWICGSGEIHPNMTLGEIASELLAQHLRFAEAILRDKNLCLKKLANRKKYGHEKTLFDIAFEGGSDPNVSVERLADYIKELKEITEVPVMIAIDQWNAFSDKGRIKGFHGWYNPQDEKDPNQEINTVANIFATCFADWKLSWGMVIVAVSSAFFARMDKSREASTSIQVKPSIWSDAELESLKKIIHLELGTEQWQLLKNTCGHLPRFIVVFATLLLDDRDSIEYIIRGYYRGRVLRLIERIPDHAEQDRVNEALIIQNLMYGEDEKIGPYNITTAWEQAGLLLKKNNHYTPICDIVRNAIIYYGTSKEQATLIIDILAENNARGEALQVILTNFIHQQSNMTLQSFHLDGTDAGVIKIAWDSMKATVTPTLPDRIDKGVALALCGSFPAFDVLIRDSITGVLYLIEISKTPISKSNRSTKCEKLVKTYDSISSDRCLLYELLHRADETLAPRSRPDKLKNLPQHVVFIYLTTGEQSEYNPRSKEVKFYDDIHYVTRSSFMEGFKSILSQTMKNLLQPGEAF